MKYYIFKTPNDDQTEINYGFVPEDKISEGMKQYAFKVLTALPEVEEGSIISAYKLSYDEDTDIFRWVPNESI